MTLPASGTISLSDVLAELQVTAPSRALPISLGDSDVLALAGKSAAPISLSDLYGKSSYVPMTVAGVNDSGTAISNTAGTVTCHPSVTVTNGSGTKTFLWSFTSNPNGCTLANATLQTCDVSHTYATNARGSANATLQCAVTDSRATITTGGITASLDWAPPI